MFYTVMATFQDGETRKYEVKGMGGVMKIVARLKASSEVVFNDNKMVSYTVEESKD